MSVTIIQGHLEYRKKADINGLNRNYSCRIKDNVHKKLGRRK